MAKSKAPAPDPNYGQAQLGISRTAEAAEARAAQNDAYFRETFAPRYLAQMDSQLALSREESTRQQSLSDYAMGRAKKFDGLQDEYLQQVKSFDTEANRERMAGMAIADVNQAISEQRGQTVRQMGRMGINPASGNFAATMAGMETSAALGKAAAANMAREAARREGMSMRAAASGMGASYLGQASGFGMQALGAGGMGMDAVSAAANGFGANNASWGSAMGLAGNMYGNMGNMSLSQQRLQQSGRTQGVNFGSMISGGLQGYSQGGWMGAIGGGLGGGMQGYGRSMGG